MRNTKLFLVALLVIFSLPAQAIKPVRVQRAVSKARSVVSGSALANRAATARLHDFASRAAQTREINAAFLKNAFRYRKKVFEVQISKTPHNTASAFALNIGGRTVGVTAAHVMENIRNNPFAKVKTANGDIIAPITSFRIGNKKGNDVAIFEVPQEILPHIQVLNPAHELPAVGLEIQSPRFVWGKPMFIQHEDIMFAGQHRILLRDRIHQDITGSCGAPILANGEVIGVHVGSFSQQAIPTISWNQLLLDNHISLQSSLHVASPIEQVLQLVAQETGTAGNTLKVLGHPVYLMSPQEYLYSISLFRNGHIQKTYNAHPFMNFDKLEEFFELEENDILRIQVETPPTFTRRAETWFYDVNVSTGEVFPFQYK